MAETYFVRTRGRVSGPFDVGSLQKLVRRGMLSRAHEVSPDRQTWSSASDFEELFPATAAATATVTTEPVAAVASGLFYYVQSGETVGPVPLSVMASLVRTGTIGPDDIVWSDGGQTAQVAAGVPALAALFKGGGAGQTINYAGRGGPAGGVASDADRAWGQRVLAGTTTLGQVAGIVSGCVLLLFLNLPIASVDGKTVWWWDVLKLPGTGMAAVSLFFILFAGIGVAAVGATVRGMVRGWIFFGVAAVGFLLLLVATLYQPKTDGGLVFSLSVPFLAACLIGVLYCRGRLPGAKLASLFGGIVGGLLLGTTLISAILWLVDQSNLRQFMHEGELPGWAVMAITLGLVGSIAGLAAGVLGLVGLKPTYTPGVNWTAVGAAGASLVLPFLAVLVATGGVAAQLFPDKTGLVVFGVFRIEAVFAAFLTLLAVGLAEVFVAGHVNSVLVVRPRGRG
jgi:hypothetical protein